MAVATLKNFIHHESTGGIVLFAAALVAMVVANSGLSDAYQEFMHLPLAVQIGSYSIDKSLLHWVNDGLMAIFFFFIGLEVKREVLQGELSNASQIVLPALAAFGGMVVPVGVYLAVTAGDPVASAGWAVPAATDIAFALGILSLLGPRVPLSLKIFLLALAIFDDIGAILIIALFFGSDLSIVSLAWASAGLSIMVLFNFLGVKRTELYLFVGILVWAAVLESGIHATLAGVIMAFTIPLRTDDASGQPLLPHLEHMLHPWVAFLILPAFAFTNAGVSFEGLHLGMLLTPIPLGVILGLVVGKVVGVFGMAWLGTFVGLCRIPDDLTWSYIVGVAMLAGIGFTMSLFIGTLAFEDDQSINLVRIGVIVGSLIAGTMGYFWLNATLPAQPAAPAKVD
ncbi:MAG: Na+/H+ antiporter NhaA [Alphaproteobacteria bacterium]|nr:MAG: Na+/H+ antiporter NhaA [Alphaproteobacteria bacterium]